MKKLFLSIGSLFTVLALAFSATPVNAYPTGSNLSVKVSAIKVDPGAQVLVSASNAYPGCTVTFTSVFKRKVEQTFSAVASNIGKTSDVTFTPSQLGTYAINASFSCNGFSETATASVQVGRVTTTTIDAASASGKVFTASGFIKWGALAAPKLTGSAVFKNPAGSSIGSVRVTSSTTGAYSATLSTRTVLPPGTYSVTVTFADSSPYIGSSAGPRSIVKTALVVLGKASYKTKIK